MKTRFCFIASLLTCLFQPALAWAQLSSDENRLFYQFLNEPDDKKSLEKRLKLIADALEREGDPKRRLSFTYPIDLKRARIPAAEGIPFLLQRLEETPEGVKRHAIRMLGEYQAEAKTTTPTLLKFLKDERPIRVETLAALPKIDTANGNVAAAILERLGAKDADDLENRTALQALIAMAPAVPKSALPQIEKFLEHRVADFGVSAHELIGKIHALKRPDLDEIKALESIDWRKSPDQGYAVLAGVASAGSKADFAAPLLLAMLDSMPPVYLEVAALDVLGKIKTEDPKAVAAIIDRLAAKDLYVRNKARYSLMQGDPKKPLVIRHIALGLKHDDLNVRLGVASTLRAWDDSGRIPPEALTEMLAPLLDAIAAFDDNPPITHLDAYLALLRRFGQRAAPASERLAKLLANEVYFKKLGLYGANVRGKVIASLANIGVPESARPHLMKALEKGPALATDGGFEFAAAARAASTFPQWKEVVPLLLPGLSTTGPEKAHFFIDWSGDTMLKPTTVRLELIRALAKFERDAEEALPLLKEIVEKKETGPLNLTFPVRQEARRAYLAIAGVELPPEKNVFADGKTEQLHLDDRLHVKLTLKVRNARAQDVLKRLEQATKLKFTMDENIDADTPAWASMHSMGMPAFQTMRALASASSVQGKWEDTGDGYRLVANKNLPDQKPKTKIAFPPFRDDSFDPMPEDPRLQKAVTIQMTNATVPDILKRVSDATGVPLSVEKVDAETPLFGSFNWSNGAAWHVLRSIAESPRVQGNWEKVGDGYRLRGTFVAPPVVAKTAPPVTAPLAPAPTPQANAPVANANDSAAKPRTSLFIAAGVLFAIFVGAGFLLLLKLLMTRATSDPSASS